MKFFAIQQLLSYYHFFFFSVSGIFSDHVKAESMWQQGMKIQYDQWENQ